MTAANKIFLSIAKDFSVTPGPRYIIEGDYSGQDCREKILLPRLQSAVSENKKLFIDLDGTAGYGTSFLEETFGGLIRENGYKHDDLLSILEFKSDEETYLIDDINNYLLDENKNA